MSRVFATVTHTFTPTTNPETWLQILAAANHAVALSQVALGGEGNVSAAAQIKLEIIEQDDVGGLTEDSALIKKVPPAAAETVQFKVFKRVSGAEPASTSGGYADKMLFHQLSSRVWVPNNPYRELRIGGGKRFGIRNIGATVVPVTLTLSLEE